MSIYYTNLKTFPFRSSLYFPKGAWALYSVTVYIITHSYTSREEPVLFLRGLFNRLNKDYLIKDIDDYG